MTMPAKILTIMLLVGAAALALTACTLLENSPLGQPPPTESPTVEVQPTGADAGQPSSDAGSNPSQPTTTADSGAMASTPQVQVSGGRSVKQWSVPPTQVVESSAPYTAVINTSAGSITVELLTQEAPRTVNNFVFLARQGFYDNVIFHRVVAGFMIQGGDPSGTGSGGPGYKFADEPVNRPYTRGTMAMANAGPNTNGSQFFLMHADYRLQPNYTIFGQAIAGLETIDAIATAETLPSGEGSSPVSPVVINSVEIIGP